MVARGAGAVGCAHCTLIGADRACQVCTRMVCERCAADWATCGEPSGRVVRLGLTARLRDVDPNGRLGYVTHWRQVPRLFDLRQLRWVRGTKLSRGAYLWNRAHPPRLTGDGRLIYGWWTPGTGYEARGDTRLFNGIHVDHLRSTREELIPSHAPEHGTAVTATGDVFYYVTDTQRVAVVAPGAIVPTTFEPLPRKVVQAAWLDAERSLLAASSWNEVALHRIVGNKLEVISHRKTEAIGDVRWLAFGGPWLVLAVVSLRGGARVEIYRFERNDSIGELVHRHTAKSLLAASLSRDGRYLALATADGLLVHDLDADTYTVFTEHTDTINLVRFAGDDHVLISADTDNRVVMRPRTPTGYARPLIAIDVPAEGVEIPARDEAPIGVA